MTVQRVLITGSRKFPGTQEGWAHLRAALKPYARKDVILIHGGASGADSMAGYIWSQWGLPVEVHKADWIKYGKSAGYKRNELMVAHGADVCVAFFVTDPNFTSLETGKPIPLNVGTGHCVNIATQWGIDVVRHTFTVTPSVVPVEASTRSNTELVTADAPAF